MEAAEGGIARDADGRRQIAGCSGQLLGLRSGVGRNGCSAETSQGEDDDKGTDDVVLHG